MLNKIIDFLRFIRLPNLLIIMGVQYLLRYGILVPILSINAFELQMSASDFFLMSLSTMLLAAAAYVINDYFDHKTDLLNHPEEVLLGNSFSRRQAMAIHIIFNTIAVLIGFWLSWKLHIPVLGLAYLIVPGILFFYSNSYKRLFLLGNLIFAFLIAMIPLLVVLFEIPLLNQHYKTTLIELNANFNHLFYWIFSFSVFTFGMCLIYDWLKDLQDSKGDKAFLVKSLPVVLGEFVTKFLISLIGLALMALAIFLLIRFIPDTISLIYFIVAVFLPFVLLFVLLFTSHQPEDYRKPILLAKIIMLAGVLYIGVAHYIITQTFNLPFPCF